MAEGRSADRASDVVHRGRRHRARKAVRQSVRESRHRARCKRSTQGDQARLLERSDRRDRRIARALAVMQRGVLDEGSRVQELVRCISAANAQSDRRTRPRSYVAVRSWFRRDRISAGAPDIAHSLGGAATSDSPCAARRWQRRADAHARSGFAKAALDEAATRRPSDW